MDLTSEEPVDINFDPAFLLSPFTPINLFVNQDLVPKIHQCRALDPMRANMWIATTIRIPVSQVEAIKASKGIRPGPVATDPARRYNANEVR